MFNVRLDFMARGTVAWSKTTTSWKRPRFDGHPLCFYSSLFLLWDLRRSYSQWS
jgi:hypothetical protein